MHSFTVCTTVYESGLRFFDDYCRGLASALSRTGEGQKLVLVADDLETHDLEPWISRFRDLAEVTVSKGAGGPAALRRQMLALAATRGTTAIVCYDMDDVPLADGLLRHGEALEDGDITFGDMKLIDEDGRPLNQCFFAGADIPDQVETTMALLRRNFLGFSNTVIRSDLVASAATRIPDHLVAVDWWFFTALVAGGYRAVKTDGPVVAYRRYGDNTLGWMAEFDPATILERCAIIRGHYAHLMDQPGVRHEDRRIAALQNVLRDGLPAVPPMMDRESSPGVWFDDVFSLLDALHISA